jgi:hypothetical protein
LITWSRSVPLLDINRVGGRAELAFVELIGTIITGAPAYAHRYERDFWADLDARPELRHSFDARMNWRFQVQAPQIAERFDWRRFSEILPSQPSMLPGRRTERHRRGDRGGSGTGNVRSTS